MKKILFLLCLLPSMFINAQIVDCAEFNEKRMDAVMLTDMHNHVGVNNVLLPATVKKGKIYKFIKKNCNKLSVDELNIKINEKILTKFDSKKYVRTNEVGSIGFLDSISCESSVTYQEISKRVINSWSESVDGCVFNYWSKFIEIDTFYNKKSKTIYIFFAYLR